MILEEIRANPTGGNAVLLRLDRPEALNSFSKALLEAVSARIDTLENDKSIRALIVTGTEKAFSTGADLKERRTMSEEDVRVFLEKVNLLFRRIETLPFPTVAAVQGYAFGGGLELALSFDFRLIFPNATIGLTETSLGIIPGAGGTQRLTRLIGPTKSKEMIYSAKRMNAEEALSSGIGTMIVNDLEGVWDFVFSMTKNAPLAIAAAKSAIDGGYDLPIDEALIYERKCYDRILPTKDRLEALAAFQEKRSPQFKGE